MTKRSDKQTVASTLPQVGAPFMHVLLGLSRVQFDRLVRNGILPKAAPRRFEVDKVVPAYLRYLKDGKAQTTDIATARLNLTNAQHKSLEQKTRIEARELVEADEVERIFSGAMVLMAAALEGLPGRLLAAVRAATDDAMLLGVLRDECRRTRASTAAELETFSAGLEGRAADEAAAEPDGGRMGGGDA